VNTFTTITDTGGTLDLQMVTQGNANFNSTKVVLGNTAVFQDYANAVIASSGDASSNSGLGWFQYNGDTYLVQSLHNAISGQASFVNGVDAIVKLTGLIDLSAASTTGNGIYLA
jgi:S-layer protein